VLDDDGSMERSIGRKETKKQAKKDKGSTSSHVRSILKDYKEHKIEMKCKNRNCFCKNIFAFKEKKVNAKHKKAKIKRDIIVIV
jgi:hypothetical protein